MALSAYGSAAEFFGDAISLLPSDEPRRPRLMLQRARALFPLGGAGLELVTEALEAFRAAGDAERVAEAATVAAGFSWDTGDRAATDRYLAAALDAVGEQPASRARAAALVNQSGFHMLAGRFDESISVGAEALPLVEALRMDDQRARLHIVVGCARCCLGDAHGLDEIEAGISVAQAANALDKVVLGYGNLSSELHFFGRLAEARHAWTRQLELSERYGLNRSRRMARADAAEWAYLDGRWDEAIAVADDLITAPDAGDHHYNDPGLLSLRAWIRLARGDAAGAEGDSARAAELARASDLQAQSAAYCVRASVALSAGKRDEAGDLASELTALGPPMVAALCSAFPTLVDVAWVFRDLDREREFREAVLDADPIKSPWNDAARAICGRRFRPGRRHHRGHRPHGGRGVRPTQGGGGVRGCRSGGRGGGTTRAGRILLPGGWCRRVSARRRRQRVSRYSESFVAAVASASPSCGPLPRRLPGLEPDRSKMNLAAHRCARWTMRKPLVPWRGQRGRLDD